MIASRLKCKVSWDQPHFWWLIIITRKIGNDTLETFLHNLGLLIKPGGITSKSNALSFQCSEVFSWKKPRSRVSPLCWVTLVETRNEVPEGVEICKTLSCKNWPLANQAFCAQINEFLFFFFFFYFTIYFHSDLLNIAFFLYCSCCLVFKSMERQACVSLEANHILYNCLDTQVRVKSFQRMLKIYMMYIFQ